MPALVIGVVRNGETSIHGFGERAGAGSKAPDRDTLLRIGSITKAFTGQVLATSPPTTGCGLPSLLPSRGPTWRLTRSRCGTYPPDRSRHPFGGLRAKFPMGRGPNRTPSPHTVQTLADWLKKEPLLFKSGTAVLLLEFRLRPARHGLIQGGEPALS